MAAEFIAEQGALKGLILSLEAGEEWTIGRDPTQCDIVIEDPKADRRHLICRKTDEGYIVENLSETIPTLVNDFPITAPTLLKAEDMVTIGETLFTFYPEGVPLEDFSKKEEEGFLEEPSDFEAEPEPEEEIVPEREEGEPEEEKPEEVVESEEEKEEEVEEGQETLFEESEIPEPTVDLTQVTRFMIKVIAGPNTGAEFALDLDRTYLMGTDTSTCEIVFNDLSVSREHARMTLSKEGEVKIEDLESRNGVVVDRERIAETTRLGPNAIVSLGTSAFLLIDREAPAETITAAVFEPPAAVRPEAEEEGVEEKEGERVAAKKVTRPPVAMGPLILAVIIGGMTILLGIGMVSLFRTGKVETTHRDYLVEVQEETKQFPGVRFTYNKASGKLFLVGHVKSGIAMNELLYKLHTLSFIKGIENNVVNDEAVWQEMNILLSKHSAFKGVSMHAPRPGHFVLAGYLENERQAAGLTDYMNVNFNYLDRLENRVVVENQVVDEVTCRLQQNGFGAVNVSFINGDLQLTGYISSTKMTDFHHLAEEFSDMPGVRSFKDCVVAVTPEQGVIDLSRRFPGRFRVTGYSQHGDVNVNVVVNGKILTRGGLIDGYVVTSIQPNTIFLEKNGLKYKINYNK